ncbi:Spindle pole body protein [Heracleum sosnowskyi]|uniref:Spindle pole body protein n=1 Tax=Heracleum sosnowskyi TaxID=360622 RepID=A0AAD8H9Q1_9APIA|nr:Spindle pole body protein [Heracleum sosnowskyi]
MFNTLLKSKFQIKCKSSIKLTNMRLEIIKKKRFAMQKYLMIDITYLLQHGHDSNAYARAGGFLEEMNLSSCYEYVELCCLCISTHLSAMCKDRECPEDCRDAASTLMFAAARFGDLPELRELRSLFTERYGKSIESYVNKEFVAKLKSAPRSKDKKLQLLKEIAHGSGIEWNSKALEQQLYKPPAVEQPPSVNQKASKNISGADTKKQDNQMVISGDRKQEFYFDRKDEVIYDGHEIPKSMRTPSKVIQAKKVGQNVRQSKFDPASLSREEVDGDKSTSTYISVPPPYTSPTVSKTNPILDCLPNGSDTDGEKSRKLNVQLDKKSKEIPKSVRTRRAKPLDPLPGHDNIGSSKGDEMSKNSDGKEQEDAKENMSDLSNEEERKMDKFLMHYRNKNGTPEPSKEETHPRREEYSLQSRAASLPVKPTSPEETKRVHTRATSYQTDTNAKGYVQPMLPDYDDFVARLAALRGDGR